MRDIDNKEMIHGVARILLDHMAQKTTHLGDEIMTVPMDYYASESRFAAEKSEIFRKQPLLLGFSCELPNPGDYKLHEEAGVPVIIHR